MQQEVEKHLWERHNASLEQFEYHLQETDTRISKKEICLTLLAFKDFFFHDHPNEEVRLAGVAYFFNLIKIEELKTNSPLFFPTQEKLLALQSSDTEPPLNFDLFSKFNTPSQLKTIESFYPQVEAFHQTMRHSAFRLNTMYAQHREAELVSVVKEYTNRLPTIDFGSFHIRYACEGKDFEKKIYFLLTMGEQLKKNADGSSMVFYKVVPLRDLASIQKNGLSSKYGGSGPCGQLHERGLMFVGNDLILVQMYHAMLGSDTVLLKLKIPPRSELPRADEDQPEFLFHCDYSFVGTIPADWIEVSYNDSDFSPIGIPIDDKIIVTAQVAI